MFDLKSISKDIARIDIEKVGFTTIFVRVWKRGYNAEDAGAPDIEDMLDGGTSTVPQLCAVVEAHGFSITMSGANKARALRGEVTRVDFVRQVDGWHIKKYPHGWKATTRPMSDVIKSEDEIRQAIAWCREHGWIVRENKGYSRAWKRKLMPVHTAEEMRRLREKATSEQRSADFAYDF